MNRRSLLLGLGSALAAPAIVKAESLMKIAAVRHNRLSWVGFDFGKEPSISVIWPPSSTVSEVIAELQMVKTKLHRDLYQALHDNISFASRPGYLST